MDFLTYIKEAGPFTAPLSIGMVFVIRHLLGQITELKSELKAALNDATELREKRATDLEKAAIEYREQGEASRNAMREWMNKADDVLDAARRD